MNMRQSISALSTTCVVVLQAACGGGGGTSSSPFNDGGINVGVLGTNNGCEQEYFQTMLGTYTGMIESNRVLFGVERMCQWDLSLELKGNSTGPRCTLQAVTEGEVTQSTFYPDDDFERYQCLDDRGTRLAREPIGITFPSDVYPGLDNSYFPVEIHIGSVSTQTSGPYFGDETTNAKYVQLFDGVGAEVVIVVVEGDGTITLRGGAGLLGTLVKEE